MKQQQAWIIGLVLCVLVLGLSYVYWQSLPQASPVQRSLTSENVSLSSNAEVSPEEGTRITATSGVSVGEGTLVPLTFNRMMFAGIDQKGGKSYVLVRTQDLNGKSTQLRLQSLDQIMLEQLDGQASLVSIDELALMIVNNQFIAIDTVFNSLDNPVVDLKQQQAFMATNGLPENTQLEALQPTSESQLKQVLLSDPFEITTNVLIPIRIRLEKTE